MAGYRTPQRYLSPAARRAAPPPTDYRDPDLDAWITSKAGDYGSPEPDQDLGALGMPDDEPQDEDPLAFAVTEDDYVDPSISLPGADPRSDTLTGWISDQAAQFDAEPEAEDDAEPTVAPGPVEEHGAFETKSINGVDGAFQIPEMDPDERAQRDSESNFERNKWARALGSIFSGGSQSVDRMLADQQDYYTLAPLKAAALRREKDAQRSAQAAQQAQQAEKVRQFELRQAAEASQRDPDSPFNARRRDLDRATWQERQAQELADRLEFERQTAEERRRRAALVGGQRDPGAPMPMRSGGSGRAVTNQYDAEAEALLQQFTVDGVQPPPHVTAMADQLRNPQLPTDERRILGQRIADAANDWRKQNDEAAKSYGAALETSGISSARAALAEAREALKAATNADGQIEGVDSSRWVAGTPLEQLATSERGRNVQRALGKLAEIQLRNATGAAAPDSEKAQYQSFIANRPWSSPEDLSNALGQTERFLDGYEQRFVQTYSPRGAEVFYARQPRAQSIVRGRGAGVTTQPGRPTPTDSPESRTVKSRRRNPTTGQILVIYSDGSREVMPGE